MFITINVKAVVNNIIDMANKITIKSRIYTITKVLKVVILVYNFIDYIDHLCITEKKPVMMI